MSGSARMTDAREWIIQRCTQRRRPAECVGGFELIYEDWDLEPVSEERMQAMLKSLGQFGNRRIQRPQRGELPLPGARAF
jgi:hypothetical protein